MFSSGASASGDAGSPIHGHLSAQSNTELRKCPGCAMNAPFVFVDWAAGRSGKPRGVFLRHLKGLRVFAGFALLLFAKTDLATPTPGTAYSFFSLSSVPELLAVQDHSVELGLNFQTSTPGAVTAIRFYKASGDGTSHAVKLWDASGHLIASAKSSNETAYGWQQIDLVTPAPLSAGVKYTVSYHSNGIYAANDVYFTKVIASGPLSALASPNGVYAYGRASAYPTSTYQTSNYWVDVVFSPAIAPTPTPIPSPAPAPGTTYSFFSLSSVPEVLAVHDHSVELGLNFQTSIPGHITAIRFYKASGDGTSHAARLWDGSGYLIASAKSSNETAYGWQQVNLMTPVPLSASVKYTVSYHSNGIYAANNVYFTKIISSGPLRTLASPNGVYAYGTASAYPASTYETSNYWVDVVFSPAVAPAPNPGPSSSVTLAWNADPPTSDPVTNAIGYRLHYGFASGNYSEIFDVGNTTTTTVANLKSGSTYYFVTTAYNAAGVESPPSNEVSFTVPERKQR